MKILIADDDVVSRIKVDGLLTSWGYDVVSAADGATAWEMLQRLDAPRLAILDWMMPEMDGVEICRKVRELRKSVYVYILLLTSKTARQDVVAGMEAGADDFLSKPFDAQELQVRVRAGQRIVELQETLRMQATHDALTGLWNRKEILEKLDREILRAGRTGNPIGVAIADLDHFKKINDTYGHLAGDAVLQEAARRMAGVLRPYDALGRVGGEEFLAVLPGCAPEQAAKLGERLRQCIADAPAATPSGPISCTVSVGVVTAAADEKRDVSHLLQLADEALYCAKREGRNRVEVTTQSGVYQS